MKLLFDENLSPKLPNRLSDLFPNSLHVRDVGMKATIGSIVWDDAKDNHLMIVSKDAVMQTNSQPTPLMLDLIQIPLCLIPQNRLVIQIREAKISLNIRSV